jgi:hypothetical protein
MAIMRSGIPYTAREKQHELERRAANAVQEVGIPNILVYQPRSSGNAHCDEDESTRWWSVAQWGGCPEIVSPPEEIDSDCREPESASREEAATEPPSAMAAE